MALTLGQIRDHVRAHLDIEAEDLPNAVLDVFIDEGFQRCHLAERRWPFYRQTWNIVTTAGVASYELGSTLTQASDLGEVTAIQGPRWNLRWIGEDEADRAFPLNTVNTGEPVHFTIVNKTIILYPTPNDVYTYTVKGYREPPSPSSGPVGAVPDCPEVLHNTIAKWAMAMAYQQQDDPEMANVFERQFADELNLFRRRLNSVPMQQPIVLGSGSQVTAPQRLRYFWE